MDVGEKQPRISVAGRFEEFVALIYLHSSLRRAVDDLFILNSFY